jgi:serine/threonine protein kinase
MPNENLCPDGHLWHAQAGEHPGQPSLVCLICGLVADFVSDDVAPTYQSESQSRSGEPSRTTAPLGTRGLPPDAAPVAHDPTLHMIKDDATARRDLYPISTPADREIVPGYEILRELGRGGMGVVYKARQVSLQRVVALKMVLSAAHARERDLDRFRGEAQAVANLHHPNIVEIYEFGEHDGLPYYSLEYVEGGNLSRKIRGRPFPPLEAARIAEELARAIQFCHQRGVIHRDLKPSNILLQKKSEIQNPKSAVAPPIKTTEDKEDTGKWKALIPGVPRAPHGLSSSDLEIRISDFDPKISDFGLAKLLESDPGLTKSGMVMGTPSYMAPEQTQGRIRDVGTHTDIYALGTILYEMLTGRPPFKAESVLETMELVGSCEPAPPSRICSKVPRDLETICLKAMAKDPEHRYRSALALAQDLERFRAGESIVARREGTYSRLWRRVRRRPITVVAFILLILFLVGTNVYFHQRTAQINSIRNDLEAGMEVQEWTASQLEKMEDLVEKLGQLDAEEAAWKLQLLHWRFAQSIRTSIQQNPTLEEREIRRIRDAIDVLALRDSTQAELLRKELNARLQEMRKGGADPGR